MLSACSLVGVNTGIDNHGFLSISSIILSNHLSNTFNLSLGEHQIKHAIKICGVMYASVKYLHPREYEIFLSNLYNGPIPK